jgi:anti-anti-sigma factor
VPPLESPQALLKWPLRAKTVSSGDVSVLELSGRLGIASAPRLSEVVSAFVEDPNKLLLIDLAGVDYVSSAGIQALKTVLVPVVDGGTCVAVSGMHEPVRLALELGGLLELLLVGDTRQAAIAELKRK